jgi:hypothetical protein
MTGLSRRGLFRVLAAAPLAAVVARLPAPIRRMVSPNYLMISMITRDAVKLFVSSNAFIRSIDRQFDDEFSWTNAKIGSQIRIRLPGDYVGRPGA